MTRRSLLQSAFALVSFTRVSFAKTDDPDRAVFQRVNELRAARGAPPLAWSVELAQCALEQSERKADLRFPGHKDPVRGDVLDRLSAAGLRPRVCGENLFSMNGYEEIADFAIVFWWYSLGHQHTMVGEQYTQTGVGITRADDGTWFATQIFSN